MAAPRSRRVGPNNTPNGRRTLLAALAVVTAFVAGATDAQAGHDFGARPYLRLGLGQSLYVNRDASPGLDLLSPSGQPLVNAIFGVDLSKYWGVEFSIDYNKTDLRSPSQGTLGDFSWIAGSAAVRLRYPSPSGRFVPYALLGAGYGFGDFSGRKNFTFPVGGRGWSPLGVVGIGGEYFIRRNIAVGLEARDFFEFHPDLTVNGQKQTLNADSIGLLADMRVYFDSPGSGPKGSTANLPPAKDSNKFRTYMAVRGGKALFTDTDKLQANGITIDSSSGPLLAGGIGANFSRYWGAEVAFEYARAQLRTPANYKITGYPVWTMLGLIRLRYPVLEDRVVPYVIFGGGAGWAETGDRDVPQSEINLTSSQQTHFVGAAGIGVDYFLQDNVALTFETRDTFGFETNVQLNGVPLKLNPSFISFTGGIRVFFD